MTEIGYAGRAEAGDDHDEMTALFFAIEQRLNKIETARLVKVVAVRPIGGASVGKLVAGKVDVKPLVNMVDGEGIAIKDGWGTLYNLPYFRMQGGVSAIKLDPAVGDIGIAIFSSQDISAAKNAKDYANPGSFSRFYISDVMYLGGILNDTTTQYIEFTQTGINVVTPIFNVIGVLKNNGVTVIAP